MSKAIFVMGATGKQGGALIRSLLASPEFSPSKYTIYAFTRDPASASAKRLASRSSAIKLVKGALDDAKGAFSSLPSPPWGVFIITMPGGPKEETIGKAFVDESIRAGAKHIIYSTVERGAGNDGFNPTNVPHFITKHNVEKHLMNATKDSRGNLTYTILRPVFFLDNLEWGFIGKIISTAWRDHVHRPLQVVDTNDIGVLGANAFLQPSSPEYQNKAISIAGDELTFEQADTIFKEKTGQPIPVTYSFFTTIMFWLLGDISKMFKFFDEKGYSVDIQRLSKLSKPTTFSEWVDKSKYAKKSH